MQTQHPGQGGFPRQHVDESSSSSSSARTSAARDSAPSLLHGRPLSLGNLLIQRDSVQSRTQSIASKRSYDVLSPASPAFPYTGTAKQRPQVHQLAAVDVPLHATGGQPTSSNPAPAAPRYVQGLTSPTGSIHSIASTSTVSTTATTFPSTARSVLLLQNGHGVRTRVNIVPASAAVAANKAGSGLGAASAKDRRTSSALHTVPSSCAVSRSTSPQPYHMLAEGTSRAAGMSHLGLGQVNPPPRVQSALSNRTSSLHRQDSPNASSLSPQLAVHPIIRRTVSDSTALPLADASGDTAAYRFPAASKPLLDNNHAYMHGTTSTSPRANGGGTPPIPAVGSARASEFGSLTAHPSSSPSTGATFSSSLGPSPMSGTPSNHATYSGINGNAWPAASTPPASAGPRQHPLYQRSHTADDIYTTSPFELSNSGTLIRPNAPFTSHSSKPSRTHLANIPKSLIPGGYDFSPSSTSTHDSHHHSRNHQASASMSAFTFARDRSASVPRTVSSIGDDSGRSSVENHREQHQMPALPEGDATFMTAKQTLENGSFQANKGDDSGHTHLASAFSTSSQGASSRQSTEEENANMLSRDVVAPLISPIPPKLDLDFGNSSGFSFDFGSDFGGSLGLSFGGGSRTVGSRKGSSFGLSYNGSASSMSTSRTLSTTVPVPRGNDRRDVNRGQNESTANTTLSSFLSLQDSTLSTKDDDSSSLFLADRAAELPLLSATSDSAVKASQPIQHQNHSDTNPSLASSDPQSVDRVGSKAAGQKPAGALQTLNPSLYPGLDNPSPNLPSTQAISRSVTAIRSESPASFISSTSFSRPVSSLFLGYPGMPEHDPPRKRLLEHPPHKGESAYSNESKRTTVSSGEQAHTKTSDSSSSANLSSQGIQQNTSARASFNKSLPPVPPKSPAQARSIPSMESENSQASSLEKTPQLHLVRSQEQIGLGFPRDALDVARRSYSEHSSSYNEQRPSFNTVHYDSHRTAAQIDGKSALSSPSTVDRPLSETSGADTASVHSASTSGYTSLEVTRNFNAPNAPEVTRVYRPSTESQQDIRQGKSEITRSRANTADHFQGIKNAFGKDRPSSQDIPLAKLARPKTNIRNAWPGGELRKRDPVTDKVLETVAAKLEVWLMRHPERRMTAEEAELHNSAGSKDGLDAKEVHQQQVGARIPPPPRRTASSDLVKEPLQASLEVESSRSSEGMSNETKSACAVIGGTAKAVGVELKPRGAAMQPPLRHRDSNSHPESQASEHFTVHKDSGKTDAVSPSEVPSSLPGLTTSSSLTMVTSNDSLASTSKTSEPMRTPLTAVASSPSLDPAFATTVPLRILPKSRSDTVTKMVKRISTEGEQPWSQAWTDITEALISYRSALMQEKQDRSSLIQNGLVPTFRKEEHLAVLHNRTLAKKQKELLLDWVDTLFEDLKGAPANRGACLDGIAVIIESRLLNYFAFSRGSNGFRRYERTIASLTAFAVDKLNGKAIFANTLGFAGKMLAAAFWNLEGVALKLLRLLPAVKKQHIARVYADTGTAECPGNFPPHLDMLKFGASPAEYMKAFQPVRTGVDGDTYLYKASFESLIRKQEDGTVASTSANDAQDIAIEMSGNWLIRWTATDSDLPFAFMRAYHRQLSNFLPLYQLGTGEALTTAQLVKAPGYIFIAATLLEVCDALIHRKLRSVTTMAPTNAGVNANESANLAAGQKPKSLEIVSKRVIQTMFEIVGGSLQAETPQASPVAFASAALRHNFGCSISMWLRTLTKRTSMWDTRGIFALLDLIEGLMYNVCCPPYEEGQEEDDDVWIPSEVGLQLFDTKFILGFIKTILSKADNTTGLLRTISFLYTEFQSFTLRAEDREELCNRIILDSEIFNRLFLYYNVGVRGYFLRLLVYRLARLGSADDGKPASRDPSIIATLRLFEYRLEKIRKRHDEIDPLEDDGWDSDFSDDFRPRPKRSTVCSTWGVRNKPWIMGLAPISRGNSSESDGEECETDGVERVQPRLREASVDEDQEGPTSRQQPEELLQDGNLSQTLPRPSSSTSSDRPASASDPPMNSNSAKIGNVAKSALRVWNALKHRKLATGPGPGSKKKTLARDPITSVADSTEGIQSRPVEIAVTFDQAGPDGRGSPGSSPDGNRTRKHGQTYSQISPEPANKEAFPVQEAKALDNEATVPTSSQSASDTKSDLLKIEAPVPRLRKQSSRKSIRRGAVGQTAIANGKLATSTVSPRSRRSSLYSFDLDVETPRSDSFDLPRSPLHATTYGIVHSGSASPAIGSKSGVLSLSPVAFSALLEGALSFDNLDADVQGTDRPGDRLNPREHKRHKSISSARNRSRPVSVASDRTGPPPRVSKRFSKRASILPPQALDLLKESPSEPVPKIPEQYKSPTSCTNPGNAAEKPSAWAPRPPSPEPYEQRLHPYAIRGLREYEDCLDEWELFVHRVKEEEGIDGRELAALIPRLQCAWPSTWEE